MNGEIILLPTPLGDGDLINKLLIGKLTDHKPDLFFIESDKSAIPIIKEYYGYDTVERDFLRLLNKNTSNRAFNEFFTEIEGKVSVILSDGGMPGISDPGRKLIREAHRRNIKVHPLYATSSITAALACSGLIGENFSYHGYPPREKGLRIEFIKKIEQDSKSTSATQIFIDTPYRNIHIWKDILNFCDDKTEFSISIELFTDKSIIKTARISNWKKMKWPELKDKKAVFLINGQKEEKY